MNRPSDLDFLRKDEFPYLDAEGHAYLDYTGAALAPLSLVRASAARLASGVYGNPHTASPASLASTRLVEEAREAVLAFCGASAREYAVVFTPNATAAVRLVAEAYPFGPDAPLVFLGDDHNSVLGMRRYAARAGAPVRVVPLGAGFRTESSAVAAGLGAGGQGLFAFPAQSNATGVRHPLEWVEAARRGGWRVLLDAAAYLPTAALDLTAVPADFVALSWYKITGFPTGVGCLVARRDALAELRRPWFAGGTVRASSSHTDWHLPAPPPEGFEDGTLPFLALPDVTAAVAWHRTIGHDAVHHHVTGLTARLLAGLTALRHPGGEPAVRVLGPLSGAGRGPTVTFNLLHPGGSPVDERLLQRSAADARVSLRTGCFCNPGVAEEANGMTPEIVHRALLHGTPSDVDTYLRHLTVQAQGAVRASVGVATNTHDVDRLLEVCADLVSDGLDEDVPEPRTGC